MKINETEETISYERDPAIESRTKSFLKTVNTPDAKPLETLQPTEARKVLEDLQNSVKTSLGDIEISEKVISQDGINVKLYIIRPLNGKGILPAFIFLHGGGWMLGDFQTHKRLVSELVLLSGASAVFVEYSRSPEVKYPIAIEEAYATLKWLSANGQEVKVDANRLAVVGNSAGGNMATVLSMMTHHRNGPLLRLQVLLWPVTDADFDTDSYHKFSTQRFLTRNMMIWFWDNYVSDDQRSEPYVSPLKASLSELEGCPPAVVVVAENDVLRDEGIAYARKLDKSGVNVSLIEVGGMIHDFGLLNPLCEVPAVQSSIRYAAEELKKALF